MINKVFDFHITEKCFNWFYIKYVDKFQFQFQVKMTSYRSERPIRAPPDPPPPPPPPPLSSARTPLSQQSPQGCPRNSANICLVEHRSFSTLEGGMSTASFLHSSFLQAISAVMF